MKKKILICLIVCIVLFFAAFKLLTPQLKYDIGKDTHDYLGDGQYQLLTSSDAVNKHYSLFNVKYHTPVIDTIIEYNKSKNTVYFYGENDGNAVYAFLYLKDNRLVYCQPKGDVDILYANDMISEQKLEITTDTSYFEKIKAKGESETP